MAQHQHKAARKMTRETMSLTLAPPEVAVSVDNAPIMAEKGQIR
jgi:hypothetical protein